MNKLYKYLFSITISGLMICTFSNFSVAKEDNYTQLKKQSYKTLAEALFNDDTYGKFRLEIVEKLGKLADPTDQSYSEEATSKDQLFDTVKGLLKTVTDKLNKNTNNENNPTGNEKIIEKILQQGDLAIIQMLVELLNDSDYSVQLFAASSLLNIKENEALPIIQQLLNSKDTKNIIVALNVLPGLKDGNSSEKILQLAEDDTLPVKVRLNALKSLAKIDSEKAKIVSRKLINQEDLKLKTEAIALLTLQKDPEATQEYIKLVQDPKAMQYALTFLPVIISELQQDSTSLLKELYNINDNYLKAVVITYASKLKDFSVAEDIFADALSSEDMKLKLTAVAALSYFDLPEAAQTIQNLTFDEPEYYQKITDLLIRSDKNSNIPVLVDYLKLNDPRIKLAIANYLLRKDTHKETCKDILDNLLKNDNENISLTAALVLIENNYNVSDELINKLLNTELANIKAKAVLILANKKNNAIIPYLEEAINNNTDPLRAYGAALILYNMGKEDYLSILVRYLSRDNVNYINKEFINKELFEDLCNHENDWVKINAASSLLENNYTDCYPTIKKLLNSTDVKVRSKAIKLIGEYGNKEDIELLKEFLNDDYVRIRVNSSEAILRLIHRAETNTRST